MIFFAYAITDECTEPIRPPWSIAPSLFIISLASENYFEIKKKMISNKETGKRDHCYEILKIKN